MKALTTPTKLKAPLHVSLRALSDVLEYADANDGEIPDGLLPALKTAEAEVAEHIDRRLELLANVKNAIEQLNEAARTVAKRKAAVTKLQEQIRSRTFAEMCEARITKLSGSFGTFAIQESGERTMRYSVPFHTMTDIVDPNDIEKIDEKYLRKLTVFVFDREAYERHLKDGRIVKCFSGKEIYDVRPDAPSMAVEENKVLCTHIGVYELRKSHLKVTKW